MLSLKKIVSLLLAVVMAFSVTLTVSASEVEPTLGWSFGTDELLPNQRFIDFSDFEFPEYMTDVEIGIQKLQMSGFSLDLIKAMPEERLRSIGNSSSAFLQMGIFQQFIIDGESVWVEIEYAESRDWPRLDNIFLPMPEISIPTIDVSNILIIDEYGNILNKPPDIVEVDSRFIARRSDGTLQAMTNSFPVNLNLASQILTLQRLFSLNNNSPEHFMRFFQSIPRLQVPR